MALLNRLPASRFDKGKEQAQRSARANLEFILKASNSLLKVHGGRKYLEAAKSMSRQAEPFTPNQMSYIEAIYEKCWKGAEFDSVSSKHDIQKTLKY